MFFTRHKKTKNSTHIQINDVISIINDVVSSIYNVVSSINDDNLEMNTLKNKYLSRSEVVSIGMKYRILSFQKKATNELAGFSFAMSHADFF